MVHLTLEVLPEIMIKEENNYKNITRKMIDKKYIRKEMEKVSIEVKEFFKLKLGFQENKVIFYFLEECAMCLARILHICGNSRIVYSDEKRGVAHEFFEKLEYLRNISFLNNPLLSGYQRIIFKFLKSEG